MSNYLTQEQIDAYLSQIKLILSQDKKEKELTLNEKIDKQIQESINGIMLGIDFRLSIKVMELRHKENMLCININSKFSTIQIYYFKQKSVYDIDYHWTNLYNKHFDFSHFRVNSLLNIRL